MDQVNPIQPASPRHKAEKVDQPDAFPTQKVWAFLASTGFLTSFFGALSDYGIEVKPNTQALITVVLTFAAMYFTPNKTGE